MKKNVIAMMLSLVLAVGSVGGTPVLAAETTAAEETSAETTSAEADESAEAEDAAAPEAAEENEDTDTGDTQEDASGEETAPEEPAQEEEPAQKDEETAQENEDTAEETAPSAEEEEAAEEAPEAVDDAGQEGSADLSDKEPADEEITDADPERIPAGELAEEAATEDSNEALEYVMGSDIVEYARQYVGSVPYVHGAGSNKDISELIGGTDCNGFVCGVFFHFGLNLWPYRIKIRNSPIVIPMGSDLRNAKPGDIIYWEETIPGAGNGHVGIYAGDYWMIHETADSYNGMSHNVLYTPVSLVSDDWHITTILRVEGVTDREPLPAFSETYPVNIGEDFYAYIRNQAENVYLTNQKYNITGEEFTGDNTQIWRFQKQDNGSYTITSYDDNACVDVESDSTEDGANVYAYSGGYVGGANQQFYLYSVFHAFFLSPVHTKGSKMLDMSLKTHNLEMWAASEDAPPQKFDIIEIPRVHGTMPVNLGEDFYAYIRNQAENVYLTNQKYNIAGEAFTGKDTQVWRFQRQINGAYSISNADDNACVSVEGFSRLNGANVYAYDGGYVGGTNQQFYIYSAYDAYYINPVHTFGRQVLDMNLGSLNLEIWDASGDSAPQEFDIEDVAYTVKYNANGGSKAPSPQTKAYNQNLTLRDSVPVRSGYDFLGWASNKNATASEYDPGASYTANKDITLYAVWKRFELGKTTRGDMFNLAKSVKVTWEKVPGAKYYKVYREGITNKKETRKEPVIVTQRLIGWDQQDGLTNGHAYRYKIVASLTGKDDPSGDSQLSYSKVMYRLKTVVIRSVKNTEPGKVTVKYDRTTSGDSYVLRFSEREDMVGAKTKVVLGANNTSYTIGGLKKGKTYYISIRVRKRVNGIEYDTTFGVPKKITISK